MKQLTLLFLFKKYRQGALGARPGAAAARHDVGAALAAPRVLDSMWRRICALPPRELLATLCPRPRATASSASALIPKLSETPER